MLAHLTILFLVSNARLLFKSKIAAPSLSLLACVLFCAGSLWAQTIEIEPLDVEVPDADEFFTDVWKTPKNFNSPCDVGEDFFAYNPDSSNNGIWTGINPIVQGPFMGIIPIPTPGTPLAYYEDCTKLGLNFPLDANKYKLLSYRSANTEVSALTILWSNDRNYALDGASGISDSFTLPPNNLQVNHPANVFNLRSFLMTDYDRADYPWAGQITGVQINPNAFLSPGGVTHFDWLRIIDPDTSPIMDVSWATTGTNANHSVAIYADTDNSGFDGMALAHGLNVGDGVYDLQTGMLAPGTYYLYAQLESSAGNSYSVVATSDYAGPLKINGKPVFNFLSPTRMSGQEFARDERLDAWDMSQASDVVNYNLPPGWDQALQRGFHAPSISGGIFTAESDFDPAGAAVSVDTNMVLAMPAGAKIDTSKYRYFCHRSQLDSSEITRAMDFQKINDAGFYTRFIFADSETGFFSGTGGHQSVEKSITFGEGLSTYCFDLWDDSIYEGAASFRSAPSVDVIRFDPLESQDARKFAVDFIGLYAENEARDAQYKVTWFTEDVEEEALNIKLYYDRNQKDFNGTLIGEKNVSKPGKSSLTWNTNGLSDGSYYIYAVVSDGTNTTRVYSEVPVNIGLASKAIAEASTCEENQSDCIFEDLESTACVGANGFLGQTNIATVINRLQTPISLKVSFVDSSGQTVQTVENSLTANQRFDYIINDMGLQADTLGTVCVTSSGGAGSWTGGLAVYKPDFRAGAVAFGDAFDFALYYPFLNARTGRVSVPLNTFHLGTSADNTVANWISISDAVKDGRGLGGVLRYYNAGGVLIASQAVGIPDGGRADFSGHDALVGPDNLDAIGLAEFSPDAGAGGTDAKFYLTLTRYFYDCGGLGATCTNFHTAFNIPSRPGISDAIFSGSATKDAELSVIELVNGSDDAVSADIDIFEQFGSSLGSLTRGVPSRGNFNLIVNKVGTSGFLNAGLFGSTIVEPKDGFLRAFSIFYNLDDAGTLQYAYSAPFTGSPGREMVAPFNSFIKQSNDSEIFNSSNSNASISLKYIDFLGNTLYEDSFTLPARATYRLLNAPIPADTYGTTKVTSSIEGVTLRNYTGRAGTYFLPFTGK